MSRVQARWMTRPGRVGAVYPAWDVYQWISWRIWIETAETTPGRSRQSVCSHGADRTQTSSTALHDDRLSSFNIVLLNRFHHSVPPNTTRMTVNGHSPLIRDQNSFPEDSRQTSSDRTRSISSQMTSTTTRTGYLTSYY